MRFVGRELELQALEDAYHKNDFQMAVIYGRRRIGKTTLLRQFCQGKKSVFFTAIKTTANPYSIRKRKVEETLPK